MTVIQPYLQRAIDVVLDDLLHDVSAIALEGAKGVGKTETARRRADYVFYLDQAESLNVLESDPNIESFAEFNTLLIDEWQKAPWVWDRVRHKVDQAVKQTYLLTGSATPKEGIDTHSGAGRILSLHMRPMALFERGLLKPTVLLNQLFQGAAEVKGRCELTALDYANEIEASGFPALRWLSDKVRYRHLDAYIDRIIDRDIEELGGKMRKPEGLRQWLTAYAAASSTLTDYKKISQAAQGKGGEELAASTTRTYRELLTKIWILDPVPAFHYSRNPLKRVGASPKHQLVDPALALRSQKLTAHQLIKGKGDFLWGPLFESLATLPVRVAAEGMGARVSHLNLLDSSREIDLIVEDMHGQMIAIEVKTSVAVSDEDVRHLHWFKERYPDDVVDLVVLNTGAQAYRRPDGVAIVPLGLFGLK